MLSRTHNIDCHMMCTCLLIALSLSSASFSNSPSLFSCTDAGVGIFSAVTVVAQTKSCAP
eukprot:m.61365 g.61365  ORF g.61365 m.61365 type:complete len:60 (+) comp22971_c0_seq4:158-337(+)